MALARRLKAERPQLQVVFGGANWEDEMGVALHRLFPFVDYVCGGEADDSFPTFVRLLLAGRLKGPARASVSGLVYRDKGRSKRTRPAVPVEDLDRLPVPDYSDYFRALDRSSARAVVVPTVLFEGSRGCWWGAKNHCMFCGLNGCTLRFRAKSGPRALREINHLVTTWKVDMVQATDNVVNMSYFRDLFPALASREQSLRFFWEIRANLSREQVALLRDARVLHVQPGIESLNDHVLELMRKGTSSLQNVQLLKWCMEYGVHADWNLLYGFPGETDADYQQLFTLLRQVRFLNAPTACGPIRLDRFSPYFRQASAYGLVNVRPLPPYKYLYPFGADDLRQIAYYFDYDYAGARQSDWSDSLVAFVDDWRATPEPGALQAFERPDSTLALHDTRAGAIRDSAVLKGIDKDVYEFCDSAHSVVAIREHLGRSGRGGALTEAQTRAFLDALVDVGYMVTDGTRYLSLALRVPGVGGNR